MTTVAQITTIGKESIFPVITRIREESPETRIIVWVNLLSSTPPDFVSRVQKVADSIIVSTIDYYEYSFALNLLYLSYDYFMCVQDDCLYSRGMIARAMRLFADNPNMAAIGGISHKGGMTDEMLVIPVAGFPDLGCIISRKAVNRVGGMRPEFYACDFGLIELIIRCQTHGMYIVTIKDFVEELPGKKSSQSPEIQTSWKKNIIYFDQLKKKAFPYTHWWKKSW